MSEPRPRKTTGTASGATSPDIQGTPSPQLPGADYSYTVELVGTINREVGSLMKAVSSLEEASKEHGKKLEAIGKDIHAAKVVGGFLVLAAGFLGWAIQQLVAYLAAHPTKP
jgi:hypothetical protein